MSRILAIDYGKKRTGIAVSDTLQMIANGLTTVPTHELLTFILDYVGKEPVERILVGLPKQMNNEASENMKRIEPFVRLLKKNCRQCLLNMLTSVLLLFWHIVLCWRLG